MTLFPFPVIQIPSPVHHRELEPTQFQFMLMNWLEAWICIVQIQAWMKAWMKEQKRIFPHFNDRTMTLKWGEFPQFLHWQEILSFLPYICCLHFISVKLTWKEVQSEEEMENDLNHVVFFSLVQSSSSVSWIVAALITEGVTEILQR